MRRILFCTQTAHPIGGVEAWLDGMVGVLERHGWDPILGLARGPVFHRPERYRDHHPDLEAIEIDGRDGTREARVSALLRTLRRVRPDVIVPVNLYDVLEAAARWKLMGNDCRLVVMLRGFQPASILDFGRFRDFVDRAVTPARLLLELLVLESGLDPGRCHYVPAGCRPRTSARKARPLPGPIRLGYVGRLDNDDKRALDLGGVVRALDTLGVKYSLAVVGQGSCEQTLRSELGQHVERGLVRFLGWCSKEKLYSEVYPGLDAILLFSPSEAGPLVLWEAMLHGVVPISARYLGSGAERSLIAEQTALLFEVGDVPAAAAAVRRACDDAQLLARLSVACEQLAAARYGQDVHWNGWMSAFEGSLQHEPATGVLPAVVRRQSGMLERLRFSPRMARIMRTALGRVPRVTDPGAEWPHCGTWPTAALAALEERATALDAALGAGAGRPI